MSTFLTAWRKPGYRVMNGECVEVAESWRTSSYSGAETANCVEVAEAPHAVRMRDSRHPHLGRMAFPTAEWAAFVAAVRGDEL